jgi:alkylation response protein AidB-like acyl-CoA dehydrogenase
VISFVGTPCACGQRWARTAVDVSIVAGSVRLSKDGKVIRVHPIRRDRARELGAFANPRGVPGARIPPSTTAPEPQVGLQCRWRGGRPASGAMRLVKFLGGLAGGDACGRHWTEHQYPNAQGDRRPRAGMPLTLSVPSKIFTIFEGTSEIQRMLIGRTVTGLDVR